MSEKESSYDKGLAGEKKAAEYLGKNGYKILARRFRGGTGEVDIIVSKDDIIVFVEVKTWSALESDDLERAVNKTKQRKIRSAASSFLYCHPKFSACRIRFDLIFLSGRMDNLDHWEGAF